MYNFVLTPHISGVGRFFRALFGQNLLKVKFVCRFSQAIANYE